MELLLNYVYTGRVSDFKSVSVVELFKAADRYRLDHLKHMCEEVLVEAFDSLAKYNMQLKNKLVVIDNIISN